MNTLGMILNGVGGLIGLVGGIWLLVVAFKDSVTWGVVCLLCPLAAIYFAITHWEKAKKPFLIELGGTALACVGGALMSRT